MFAADHRCFDLAIDHGVFHNAEFLAGIENLPEAVATAVKAGPDAIQLGVGQTRWLTGVAGKDKPALVLLHARGNAFTRLCLSSSSACRYAAWWNRRCARMRRQSC